MSHRRRFFLKCQTCAGPTLNENYPRCTVCLPGRDPAYDGGFQDAIAELLLRVGDAADGSPASRAVADLYHIKDEYVTNVRRLELERDELRKALKLRAPAASSPSSTPPESRDNG